MRKKRALLFIAAGLVGNAMIIGMVLTVPPTTALSLGSFHVSALPLFFLLLFTSCYCLLFGITRAKKHAILLSSFLVAYLLLRYYQLTHPLFLLLLAALFLLLELFFGYTPSTKKPFDQQ